MTRTATVGRPPNSKNLIVRHLRKQILDGRLSPGSRLPTRAAIELQFKSGPGTVQRALDDLTQDGFVQSSGRGTFVAENPPHLSRYAVVLPGRHTPAETSTRLWTALSNEAALLQRNSNRSLPVYYADDTDCHDYPQLERDVLSHSVAGLIFAGLAQSLRDSPVMRETGIARVAITAGDGIHDCSVLSPDWSMFFEKALGSLHAMGRKRVAWLLPPGLGSFIPQINEGAATRGFTTLPHWLVRVGLDVPEAAHEYAQLLWHGAQPPDALVIANDNFVEHALGGLIEAGVRFPDDIAVVTHCNFPWPAPSVVPVRRLGYDVRRALLSCIAEIDAVRGGAPKTIGKIPALFESEIEQSETTERNFGGS